jgi:hypothetical protein
MTAQIYPFPTPLPEFLRKYSPPQRDNGMVVFLGSVVAGAMMVGLGWFFSGTSADPVVHAVVSCPAAGSSVFSDCVSLLEGAARQIGLDDKAALTSHALAPMMS